jgi:hypothetical protein
VPRGARTVSARAGNETVPQAATSPQTRKNFFTQNSLNKKNIAT